MLNLYVKLDEDGFVETMLFSRPSNIEGWIEIKDFEEEEPPTGYYYKYKVEDGNHLKRVLIEIPIAAYYA